MVTDEEIKKEVSALNEAASGFDRNYEYHKGNNGSYALFDVQGSNYKPVYLSSTPAGLFSYISLLKNIYMNHRNLDETGEK